MSIEKTEYLLEQIKKLKNKAFEVAILAPLIVDKDLSDIRPYAGYHIKHESNDYYIDLYYPELKIAIEIDELHHSNQLEKDLERECKIVGIENCEFKRIKIEDNLNIYQIILELKKFIIEKRENLRSKNQFSEWKYIKHSMTQVQEDYPEAIFFKIPQASQETFISVTRGPILIAEEKRNNATLFVAYSGDVVVNVYSLKPNDWVAFNNKALGYYHQGQEIPNHPLLSSGTTTEWASTSNRFFGNKLK
jgi:very-short-patch-repair endonuclease